jgi:hypothetical protein
MAGATSVFREIPGKYTNIVCEKLKFVDPLDRAMILPAQLIKYPMDFMHIPTSVSRQCQLLLTPLMVLR